MNMFGLKLTSYEKRIIGTLVAAGHTLSVTGEGWVFGEAGGDTQVFESYRDFFNFCEGRESQITLVREMAETF
jgi:hypothetical protein